MQHTRVNLWVQL